MTVTLWSVRASRSVLGSLRRDSTSEITCVLKILNQKSKSMQKSDSIQPRSCLIHKKHVAELVRRRSKNLKFSEKIVGLVKITLNYIYTESRSIFSYSSYIPSVIVLTGPYYVLLLSRRFDIVAYNLKPKNCILYEYFEQFTLF